MQIALSILFHFYLLVLVRVLSSKRIFELSHAISQRPCRPSLPLLITEKIFGIKNLVRIILSQSKHGKTIWDHSCNIDKSTFHIATGRRVSNSLSNFFSFLLSYFDILIQNYSFYNHIYNQNERLNT